MKLNIGSSTKYGLCASLILSCLSTMLCATAIAEGKSSESSSAGILAAQDAAIAAVRPALVRVSIVEPYYYGGREQKYQTSGSGVIVSEDGYVVTNHHVAGKAKRIMCTLTTKREVRAILVGTDPMADLAVLKLECASGETFPFAEFGDSSALKVGDRVMAMGSPLAISQSVTLGIVSNTEMIMPRMFWPYKFTTDGENVGSLIKWIAHDAVIFGGNSGGPLVDMNGKVVGINEINMGLSGAIPANIAADVVDELIKTGHVKRSWTGIEIQPLLKGEDNGKGALVSGAIPGSPAAEAGVEPGDILIEFDGAPISIRYPEELPIFTKLESAVPVGDKVKIVVERNGKKKTLSFKTALREKVRLKERELREWGIVGTNISLWAQKEMKRESRSGVRVKSLRPGGPCDAAKPALKRKDVIVSVDGKPMRNVKELVEITKKITKDTKELVPTLVTFDRKNEQYLTVVEVGIRELRDPGLEVRKAWLPIGMQVLTDDLASKLGIEDKTGVRVTQVYPGAGKESGLKRGDIIVSFDGMEIDASDPEDTDVLPAMVRQYKIGSEVELGLIREGKEEELTINLPATPKLAREMKKSRDEDFEFTAREVTFLDRAEEKWSEDKRGVLIEEVAEGGLAALAHLAVGDLLLAVAGLGTPNLEALKVILADIKKQKPEYVKMKVVRGIHTRFIELEPNWEE
ncbi:trypsin-like peptidase domain-containing protein [Candidatus Hydrogenedentota bacterium]